MANDPVTPITPLPPFSPLPTNTNDTIKTPSSNSSRASKLSNIIGDGTFETTMKARAQKRKEKDEHCVAELRVGMNNMDRSLTQEIKRRIEGNKVLENKAKEEIAQMEARMTQMLENKVEAFQSRLVMLEEKVSELNDRLEEEQNKIPKDIEQKGRELKDLLLTFQNEFSLERRDRLTREGKIMKQLTDHAHELTQQWTDERSEREQDAMELKTRLEHHENNRAEADHDFETLISSELKSLRVDLTKECMERKVEDDEIVEALNRYTANLQKSLSMLD